MKSVLSARCGDFSVGADLAGRITGVSDRDLLAGYTREHPDVVLEGSNLEEILAQCPRTVEEKAFKLLTAINKRTEYFGEQIQIDPEADFRLAYAKNSTEFRALFHCLDQWGFIGDLNIYSGYAVMTITAGGLKAIESRFLLRPIKVFVSSTCYDLVDLRAELADFLESKGFIAKLSDDAYRIDVDPTVDTIQTCLRNVETADVVVCIIDLMYGPLLPPDLERSATHVEVKHARELRTPIYIFGRDTAMAEYDHLRSNPDAAKSRVEPCRPERRKKWVAFVQELRDLHTAQEEGHSNWFDTFQTSVQLKKLVLKRLGEYQRR